MLDDESDAEEAVQQPPPPSGPENAPAAALEQSPAVPDYAPGAVSDSENQVADPTNVKEEEEDSDSDIEVVYIKRASKKAHRSWTKLKEEQLAHTAASALIMITFQHARIRITPALTAVFATAHDRHVLCCLAKLFNVVLGNADPLPQPARGRACLLALRVRELESCHVIARLLDDSASAPLPPPLFELPRRCCPPSSRQLPTCCLGRPASLSLQTLASRSTRLEDGSGPLLVLSAIDDGIAGHFRATLDPPALALLEYQSGPFASKVLTARVPATSSPRTRLFCLLCCFAGFVCCCRSALQPVAAAVSLTLSVTTALLGPALASCAPVASRSSAVACNVQSRQQHSEV
eukprot:s2196_g6.t1